MEINGKKVIVIGGASGMGRASAELLASRGASVAVFDREGSDGKDVAAAVGGDFYPVDVTDFAELEKHFAEGVKFPGWLEVNWSKPSGAELDKVTERLKGLKLTFRNVPNGAAPAEGTCIFTGKPAVERILVARAY